MGTKKLLCLIATICISLCMYISSVAQNPTISFLKSGKCFLLQPGYFESVKKSGLESCICQRENPGEVYARPHVFCMRDRSNPQILWVAPIVRSVIEGFDYSRLGYIKIMYDKSEAYVAANYMLPILRSDIKEFIKPGVSNRCIKKLSKFASETLTPTSRNLGRGWTSLCMLRRIMENRLISSEMGADINWGVDVRRLTSTPCKMKPYSKELSDYMDDYYADDDEYDSQSDSDYDDFMDESELEAAP